MRVRSLREYGEHVNVQYTKNTTHTLFEFFDGNTRLVDNLEVCLDGVFANIHYTAHNIWQQSIQGN